MPLHLLGKKSWNVYNPENIARVKRDEAAARAKNERDERDKRSQLADARLQILRGEQPEDRNLTSKSDRAGFSSSVNRDTRKRRKLAGEDDTDRDIRLARLNGQVTAARQRDESNVDSGGHMTLVSRQTRQTDADPQEGEQLKGMQFKDAEGYGSAGKPWYTSKSSDEPREAIVGKDVWGNEDPRRHEREQQRIVVNDPLLAMRKGVKQLRENEKQRQEWMAQRERDLNEVEQLARANRKRQRRRSDDEDSIPDLDLDAPVQEHPSRDRSSRHRDHKHKRRRHRDRSRSPGREYREHRSHRHDGRRHHSGDG